MSHFVIPTSTYRNTFFLLLVFTAITIVVAFADLGAWNAVVALVIASIKASLVAFYFMGLRWASRLIRISLGVALAGVVILFGGTLNDDLTRNARNYLPSEMRRQIESFQVQGLDGLTPEIPGETPPEEEAPAPH